MHSALNQNSFLKINMGTLNPNEQEEKSVFYSCSLDYQSINKFIVKNFVTKTLLEFTC